MALMEHSITTPEDTRVHSLTIRKKLGMNNNALKHHSCPRLMSLTRVAFTPLFLMVVTRRRILDIFHSLRQPVSECALLPIQVRRDIQEALLPGNPLESHQCLHHLLELCRSSVQEISLFFTIWFNSVFNSEALALAKSSISRQTSPVAQRWLQDS